ncbi:enoyl-CoA hydratase/isomerase family protein [Mucilaginibacter paludis]|uniref:Enoyl-CoA hydratase/isomerase n=1 Tax=Mucilaginibacter paludis DSM 18603 TaxID=714943 RepID=H1Y0M9_9SPHI|nr:enoyl-CoA hydratase/isomerase family protein [Mucilaginibacter paludis]EHQ28769.1 Enoyl-CoA hydratase/isomerase [Mucilaginibacter paludis DSM 18603]
MDTTTNEGYVHTSTDELGITTIAFFHRAQNSLPGALLEQLSQSINNAGHAQQTKIILLKSDGGQAFCAGASFDELLHISTLDEAIHFFSGFAKVINACRTSTKIIIGRIHGKAIGGGVGIAAATDHCFACTAASIKLSELTIGIGPFVIGPAVIRKIGLSAFSQLSINAADFYTAEWGKEKGLFAEVFDTTVQMDNAIEKLAQKICTWSPEALSAFKKTLWEGTENWDNLLAERAAVSGQLVLSAFAQNAISQLKIRK